MKLKPSVKHLPSIVFVTGACVLVFQVAGIRFLAPFFGSGLTTTSSVIGIMLGALALGYRKGGRLSDQSPTFPLFFKLILFSGISLLLLFSLHLILLPLFAYQIQKDLGVLLFSLTLFAPPSFFLGTISPFAVGLNVKSGEMGKAGASVGDMFFWSTMGSILGSLATGFVLIPNMGIRSILISSSLLLILIGLVGVYLSDKGIGKNLWVILISSLVIALFLERLTSQSGAGVVFAKDGVYQRLTVVDREIEGKEVRMLYQDTNASSGTDLTNLDRVVFPYLKYWEEPFLINPNIKKVLVVGAGAYSLPSLISRKYPDVQIDVVDIEPGLEEIAERYFGYVKTPNIKTHIIDARRFLAQTTDGYYDYIFLDAYADSLSIPPHLVTREFFTLVKEKISIEGLLMANVVGYPNFSFSGLVVAQKNTMEALFGAVCVRLTKPQEFKQNVIVTNYKMQDMDCHSLNSSNKFVFTDDYSPTESIQQ